MKKRTWLAFIVTTIACFISPSFGAMAQALPEAPILRPADRPDILFVASAPGAEKDENGKPALASVEPVAFFVGSEPRGCETAHPAPGEDNVPKSTLQTLNRAYAKGKLYPLWWGGAPWGEAEAVRSCIDDDYMDLDGCFRLHPNNTHHEPPSDFKGVVWTGKPVIASHPAMRLKASSAERMVFLQAASAAFAVHHVPVIPTSIHSGIVWKTQLRSGRTALAGSALVQLAAAKPKTYYSYRMFLVIEEDTGVYLPVLNQFHRTTILLDGSENPPKPGEVLDEENVVDKEVFIDNFPLFQGETDAIITEHTYYEDWNFSIYRRVGLNYKLIYTGCGGGV